MDFIFICTRAARLYWLTPENWCTKNKLFFPLNPGLKNSLAYLVNGLALIAVFFLCRIAVYPLFFKVYAASRGVSYLEGLTRPPLTCYFYVLLTLLPQLCWFRLLVKGAFKTLNKFNKEEAKPADPNSNESTKHD